MKKTLRVAWSFFTIALLSMAIFLLSIPAARAPQGGKSSLGGRTIASIQEEDFDHKILQYQICYGIGLTADTATPERRRVCKAIFSHMLQQTFSKPGIILRKQIGFACVDTAFGKNEWELEDGTKIFALKPNREMDTIEAALTGATDTITISREEDDSLRASCSFLTECKLAMRPPRPALRKLASCLTTENALHREILFDEIASMIFLGQSRKKVVYTELLEKTAH